MNQLCLVNDMHLKLHEHWMNCKLSILGYEIILEYITIFVLFDETNVFALLLQTKMQQTWHFSKPCKLPLS